MPPAYMQILALCVQRPGLGAACSMVGCAWLHLLSRSSLPSPPWSRRRVLCATTEAMCMFRLVDKNGKPHPFYDFASDGITQTEAIKRYQLIQAGGYR